MKEEIAIKIIRYRDKNNLPTCAINFQTGETCQFLGTAKFGSIEKCILTYRDLFRRNKGMGTLIPDPACPLWRDDNGRKNL